MTKGHVLRNEDNHFRILRLLEANPQLPQRAISRELGISLGAVNYCLKALAQKGYLKVKNFHASDNKRQYAYILTPAGLAQKASLTKRFLHRKLEEFELLKAEIRALEQEQEQQPDPSRTAGDIYKEFEGS